MCFAINEREKTTQIITQGNQPSRVINENEMDYQTVFYI